MREKYAIVYNLAVTFDLDKNSTKSGQEQAKEVINEINEILLKHGLESKPQIVSEIEEEDVDIFEHDSDEVKDE